MEVLAILIFGLQGLFMLFDEFYFHWNRYVPKFERIGHPIDTISVLLCYAMISFSELNINSVLIYFILSMFSCVLVTKDESIHQKYASRYEQHLHALLFVLHPVILFILFLCWPSVQAQIFSIFTIQSEFLKKIFYIQFFITFSFFLYQVIYWNFLARGKYATKPQTTS